MHTAPGRGVVFWGPLFFFPSSFLSHCLQVRASGKDPTNAGKTSEWLSHLHGTFHFTKQFHLIFWGEAGPARAPLQVRRLRVSGEPHSAERRSKERPGVPCPAAAQKLKELRQCSGFSVTWGRESFSGGVRERTNLRVSYYLGPRSSLWAGRPSHFTDGKMGTQRYQLTFPGSHR